MSGGEPIGGQQVAAAFGYVLRQRGRRQPTLAIVLRLARALAMEPAELVNRTIARLRERGCGCSRFRKLATRVRFKRFKQL
jgi:hypothetical protein